MYELSLYSGAGGGLLATHHLLKWKTIGYVEIDEYCQKVIAARIKDKVLREAPVFGDIRTFISEGYAEAYQGMVDVITAGFPCTPWSNAGAKRGRHDDRNLWEETIETCRIIRPRYILVENVASLVTDEYFGHILGDLVACGYDCRWRILSAAEVGAPHKRDRVWLVAYTQHNGLPATAERGSNAETVRDTAQGANGTVQLEGVRPPSHVSDSNSGCNGQEDEVRTGRHTTEPVRQDVSDTCGTRSTLGLPEEKSEPGEGQVARNTAVSNDEGDRRTRWSRTGYWTTEPGILRVVDGMDDRVDRIKAVGNGMCSQVVATAWHLLNPNDSRNW